MASLFASASTSAVAVLGTVTQTADMLTNTVGMAADIVHAGAAKSAQFRKEVTKRAEARSIYCDQIIEDEVTADYLADSKRMEDRLTQMGVTKDEYEAARNKLFGSKPHLVTKSA